MQQFLSKYRLLLAGFFLVLTAWFAYDMFRLNAAQELWGYRPMFLFTAFTFFWLFLFGKKKFESDSRYRNLLLALLSALLMSIGFPSWPLPFIMFIGFVPLLWIEYSLNDHKRSSWRWLSTCYLAFFLWNIWTTYWVANTAFIAGIFAITVNSALMCLPMALFHWSRKHLDDRYGYASLIAFWIIFEYGHMQWELSWPWLTLGNSLASLPVIAQWYSYTGVFGGTCWILLLNILFFKWLLARRAKEKVPSRKRLITFLVWLIAPIILSLFMFFNYEEQGEVREILVIQPNFEPHYEKFALPRDMQFLRFIELSKQGLTDDTDYLVFPETSFSLIEHARPYRDRRINELQELVDTYPGLKLVTGVVGYDILEEFDPENPNIRIQDRGNGDTLYWISSNSAIQLSSGSRDVPVYLKSKLVPGAEIFPYNRFFFFMKFLIDQLGGTIAGLGTQDARSVFDSEDGAIAPVICYESVYGEYCTGYVRQGAEAIFIITNDGWWDRTAGHRQHLQFASLRAIETRRAIARSANTGISAFIDQRGLIHQPTEYGQPTWIRGEILFNDAITFYVRWGDIIARISLFASAIFLLNLIVQVVRKRTDIIGQNKNQN